MGSDQVKQPDAMPDDAPFPMHPRTEIFKFTSEFLASHSTHSSVFEACSQGELEILFIICAERQHFVDKIGYKIS